MLLEGSEVVKEEDEEDNTSGSGYSNLSASSSVCLEKNDLLSSFKPFWREVWTSRQRVFKQMSMRSRSALCKHRQICSAKS